jgi:hypothetical protein
MDPLGSIGMAIHAKPCGAGESAGSRPVRDGEPRQPTAIKSQWSRGVPDIWVGKVVRFVTQLSMDNQLTNIDAGIDTNRSSSSRREATSKTRRSRCESKWNSKTQTLECRPWVCLSAPSIDNRMDSPV